MSVVDSSKFVAGTARIYWGVAGQYPTVLIGATTDDGVDASYTEEQKKTMADGVLYAVRKRTKHAEGLLSWTLLEFSAPSIALALGAAGDEGGLIRHAIDNDGYVSLRIEVDNDDTNETVHLVSVPYAKPSSDLKYKMATAEDRSVPMNFEVIAYAPEVLLPIWIGDYKVVTVASGVIALTSGVTMYRVIGEGAVADEVTSITGGTQGDKATFFSDDASGAAITFTHDAAPVADELSLSDEVDFVADNGFDLLVLLLGASYWTDTLTQEIA